MRMRRHDMIVKPGSCAGVCSVTRAQTPRRQHRTDSNDVSGKQLCHSCSYLSPSHSEKNSLVFLYSTPIALVRFRAWLAQGTSAAAWRANLPWHTLHVPPGWAFHCRLHAGSTGIGVAFGSNAVRLPAALRHARACYRAWPRHRRLVWF